MLTPALDLLCVGGLSVLVSMVVLLSGYRLPERNSLAMHITNFLINAPHFLVSYRLLYASRQRRHDYKAVSLYVPMALAAYGFLAIVVYARTQQVLGAMIGMGTILLAWHYTGQAYGMMSAFGFVEGLRFDDTERRLVRANLYTLLAWHVLWAVVVVRKLFDPAAAGSSLLTPGFATALYRVATFAAVASGGLGLAGLYRLGRRTGRRLPLRMVVPWLAIHLWYVLLYDQPAAIFWAQNAHALQYLLFPLRVEMNRKHREPGLQANRLWRHMLVFFGGTVVLGILAMQLVPEALQRGFVVLGLGFLPIQLAVVAFINIHHYFIDNFIWKIRNPAVRQDLFGHLSAGSR